MSDSATWTSHPLEGGHAPGWASAWGQDSSGVWASLRVQKVSLKMRWIQPGRFLMGSGAKDPSAFHNEQPQHQVSITRGFWLGETTCTVGLYRVLGQGGLAAKGRDEEPAVKVSHGDIAQLVKALDARWPAADGLAFRLPTEAEWEYACRAGRDGDGYRSEEELDLLAWYDENSDGSVHPVGRKRPNDWGLCDMLGNVFEWCLDDLGAYGEEDEVDPVGSRTRTAALRGGSWRHSARGVRPAYRRADPRDGRGSGVGFRLARGHPVQQAEPQQASQGSEP